MKSVRSWLIGLAIGVTLSFGAQAAKAQRELSNAVPRAISYQGLLIQGNVPFTGTLQSLAIYISDSAGSQSGNYLFSQTFTNVFVTDGVFNILIGDPSITPGGIPETLLFDRQYRITVVINSTTLAPQELWSSPYALNSQRAGGLDVSPIPVNGDLFPMPLDGNGKISQTMLPPIPNSLLQTPGISTISGVGPNSAGNVDLVPGSGIGITAIPGSNQVKISASGGGAITGVYGIGGLTGGGTSGVIDISIAPGGVTSSMLQQDLQIRSLVVGSSSSSSASLIVVDSETNGNNALLVGGGIGASNPTGTADGSGLSSGSPQTYWADQIAVPAVMGTSLQIYNKLVSASSTIIITPYGLTANVGQIAITSQGAGTFTVTSTSTMGTSGGGSVTGLNYVVINH